MSNLEISLKDEIGSDLGPRKKIENLFDNINKNTDQVVMNFEGVEFISRSFAQEYLNQKHFAPFKVSEINMNENIEKMFEMILKLNNKL